MSQAIDELPGKLEGGNGWVALQEQSRRRSDRCAEALRTFASMPYTPQMNDHPDTPAPPAWLVLLVPDCEHEYRLLARHVAIESHIAGLTESDHQLTQLGLIRKRPSHFRRILQKQELPLDRSSRTHCRVDIVLHEEAAAPLKPSQRAFCDDYSWHAGASLPSSIPQPRSQSRVSAPVRCWPVC